MRILIDPLVELGLEIRKAAKIEASTWNDFKTNEQIFMVERRSFNPRFIQWNYSYKLLLDIPQKEIKNLIQIYCNLLMEEVSELFEDYLWEVGNAS